VRQVLRAIAVKQRQFGPWLEPQHVDVMGDRFRQVERQAGGERCGAVKTGHADPVIGAKTKQHFNSAPPGLVK
jgi:hypothetical protein